MSGAVEPARPIVDVALTRKNAELMVKIGQAMQARPGARFFAVSVEPSDEGIATSMVGYGSANDVVAAAIGLLTRARDEMGTEIEDAPITLAVLSDAIVALTGVVEGMEAVH